MDNTNAARRHHIAWALEAAEVRRDHWQVRSEENLGEGGGLYSERMAELNNDLYEESQHNAKGIAEGIGKGIELARTMVTESEALMAMMIFEHALEDSGCMLWLKADEGAYQARDNALVIAKVFMRASDWAYANGYDDSEDWEFIPAMLPVIMRKEFVIEKVTSDICMEAAEEVVRLYLEEKDMPQGTGTGGKDDWGSIGEPS